MPRGHRASLKAQHLSSRAGPYRPTPARGLRASIPWPPLAMADVANSSTRVVDGCQIEVLAKDKAESFDRPAEDSEPLMQAESSEHKNFGQPVVSERQPILEEYVQDALLTPTQAAARFDVPEYLIRRACTESHLEHLRVVNALWLTPAAVAAFAGSWRTQKGRKNE